MLASCNNKILDRKCPPLRAIQNGKFDAGVCNTVPNLYGTVCSPMCNEGFELKTNTRSFRCEINRRWQPSTDQIECKRKL